MALPSATAGRTSAISSHSMCVLLVTAEREQPLAQLASCPVQAHLGGSLADAQLGGDGLVREVVDVPEHDHGPQLGGKLLQCGADPIPLGRGVAAGLGVVVGPLVDDLGVVA